MKALEFTSEDYEAYYMEAAKMVWGVGKKDARGGTVKQKFRCASGPRKSRQVSHPSKCFDHPNVAKSQQMKRTRARTGPTQARRQQRTKSINTASVLANRLNNPRSTKKAKSWY